MAIPVFDVNYFKEIYPMFATMSDVILENLWEEVDVVGSPIISSVVDSKQSYYYYVVEAHLAELWNRGAGVTGIVSASTQGSVSVTLEVDKSSPFLFWNQTSFGQKIVQLMKMRGGLKFIYGGQNYYDRYN
jgi:hypothetical protein